MRAWVGVLLVAVGSIWGMSSMQSPSSSSPSPRESQRINGKELPSFSSLMEYVLYYRGEKSKFKSLFF